MAGAAASSGRRQRASLYRCAAAAAAVANAGTWRRDSWATTAAALMRSPGVRREARSGVKRGVTQNSVPSFTRRADTARARG